MMPILSAIAAMTRNRVIGVNNQLPWHLPADLEHFKSVTLGHPIIMGRKNYESIARPLPGRTNIVITTDTSYTAPGCIVCHSIDDAIAQAGNDPEIFIIGGATLYEQMLPQTQRLYLTWIDQEIAGDTFFPEINWDHWQQLSDELHAADEKNPFAYTFTVYERV